MNPTQASERFLEVTQLVDTTGLMVLGGLHPEKTDLAPKGCKTLILLGPRDQHFWPIFANSPEKTDGAPDPLDRWSERVVSDLAKKLGARAVFPFGGPPYAPFYSWALRCGNIFRHVFATPKNALSPALYVSDKTIVFSSLVASRAVSVS